MINITTELTTERTFTCVITCAGGMSRGCTNGNDLKDAQGSRLVEMGLELCVPD